MSPKDELLLKIVERWWDCVDDNLDGILHEDEEIYEGVKNLYPEEYEAGHRQRCNVVSDDIDDLFARMRQGVSLSDPPRWGFR